jgi:hypothetical protein
MKKSWVSALLVASLLGSDAPAFAQASWRSVQRVADGALLSATFEDGSQVEGYFISADDSSIFLVDSKCRRDSLASADAFRDGRDASWFSRERSASRHLQDR